MPGDIVIISTHNRVTNIKDCHKSVKLEATSLDKMDAYYARHKDSWNGVQVAIIFLLGQDTGMLAYDWSTSYREKF